MIWHRSIAVRLTFLYSVITLATLAIVAMVLYWAVVDSVAQDDQRFMTEKIHVLRTMLEQRPSDQALMDEEVKWETGVLPHARYFVLIRDADRHLLQATPGFAETGINDQLFPEPAAPGETDAPMAWQTTPAGRTYLLSSATARVGHDADNNRVLQLALDVSHEDTIFSEFRRIAWIVVLIGLLVSAVLGRWVAKRSLRPLLAMADATARTSASRLQQQLQYEHWPLELQPLVREFNAMLKRLDAAFSRMAAFSADLAHELRTPLNNLMGEAEVMLSRQRSPQEYRDTLGSILEECQRLSRMTESLLFLARSDNPHAQLRRELFLARADLETVADFYDAVAEEAGVSLQVTGQGELFADRDLFRRAVTNLISNALRYSPRGSHVQLVLEHAQHEGQSGMAVTVVDQGEGIGESQQSHLFERFYRVRADRIQEASGGSGLGLAIVKSIMDLHGGQVQLQSRPGQGTRVTLWFPNRADAP